MAEPTNPNTFSGIQTGIPKVGPSPAPVPVPDTPPEMKYCDICDKDVAVESRVGVLHQHVSGEDSQLKVLIQIRELLKAGK